MVRIAKTVRTYLVSMHDLYDSLEIKGARVLEVKLLKPDPGLDDPVLEITTSEITSDE